jgi:hypothetical protein
MDNFIAINKVKNYLKKKILYFNIEDFLPPGINILSKFDDYLLRCKKNIEKCPNTMHKYGGEIPLNEKELNELFYPLIVFVKEFYNIEKLEYHFGFYIGYPPNKNLDIHVDDSKITFNICLENTSKTGNVIYQDKNKTTMVQFKKGDILIHPGDYPHYTADILDGERWNLVLWFK